jgi:two-component system, chemotaxis family, protein-glutamate methylesterase/glutaminase
MPIRVLVVDDSALIREMLQTLLTRDPDIQVVGTAQDPYDAREKIRLLDPDVITLDIEMPNMNGIAFLERLMRLRPIPVIMVSTLTQKGADVTLLALELGAVDFIAKPQEQGESGWERAGAELRNKIRAAAGSRVTARPPRPADTPAVVAQRTAHHPRALVAIGASTGGVEALREVLVKLPRDMPPMVITQHMPAGFTTRFAQRLDEASQLRVSEAVQGKVLGVGEAVIAPGNLHLTVALQGSHYVCHVENGEPVSGHRPSVDVLFRSVAAVAGRHAVGVILTGMGRDGSQGMLAMREAGARTIGQNEASSLVYGMPRAAKEVGAVQNEVPLDGIPARILADLAADNARAA